MVRWHQQCHASDQNSHQSLPVKGHSLLNSRVCKTKPTIDGTASYCSQEDIKLKADGWPITIYTDSQVLPLIVEKCASPISLPTYGTKHLNTSWLISRIDYICYYILFNSDYPHSRKKGSASVVHLGLSACSCRPQKLLLQFTWFDIVYTRGSIPVAWSSSQVIWHCLHKREYTSGLVLLWGDLTLFTQEGIYQWLGPPLRWFDIVYTRGNIPVAWSSSEVIWHCLHKREYTSGLVLLSGDLTLFTQEGIPVALSSSEVIWHCLHKREYTSGLALLWGDLTLFTQEGIYQWLGPPLRWFDIVYTRGNIPVAWSSSQVIWHCLHKREYQWLGPPLRWFDIVYTRGNTSGFVLLWGDLTLFTQEGIYQWLGPPLRWFDIVYTRGNIPVAWSSSEVIWHCLHKREYTSGLVLLSGDLTLFTQEGIPVAWSSSEVIWHCLHKREYTSGLALLWGDLTLFTQEGIYQWLGPPLRWFDIVYTRGNIPVAWSSSQVIWHCLHKREYQWLGPPLRWFDIVYTRGNIPVAWPSSEVIWHCLHKREYTSGLVLLWGDLTLFTQEGIPVAWSSSEVIWHCLHKREYTSGLALLWGNLTLFTQEGIYQWLGPPLRWFDIVYTRGNIPVA